MGFKVVNRDRVRPDKIRAINDLKRANLVHLHVDIPKSLKMELSMMAVRNATTLTNLVTEAIEKFLKRGDNERSESYDT